MMGLISTKKVFKGAILFFFFCFLVIPIGMVLWTAWPVQSADPLRTIQDAFTPKWALAFENSIKYALLGSTISTALGFLLAYGNNFSGISKRKLKVGTSLIQFPMLLPTITYGYVLLYAFGKQGGWRQVFGHELFSIYGETGILIGFVVYTLPPIFLLINNGMQFIDFRLISVSRLLGDSWQRSLVQTILIPLKRIIIVALLQGFFMCFTDFGIPSAIGGQTPLITTLLYEGFMGTIPDFQYGSVIALTMLLPSIFSIYLLHRLQKKVTKYDKASGLYLKDNPFRDHFYRVLYMLITCMILGIFLPLFIIPFVHNWPNEFRFTLENFGQFMQNRDLLRTLQNSITVGFLVALIGTFCAYFAAIGSSRETDHSLSERLIDSVATITNSIPGMVLGIAYLLVFTGTPLHNSMSILVIVTIVHYFATPYQMAKEAMQKMNGHWESTAKLMGDSWLKTIWRVLLPNSLHTIIDMFAYYFFNAMVTISAVVFLTSADTMVVTAKLKELQHFGKFNDIFLLSLFLLLINLTMQFMIHLMKRSVSLHENQKNRTFSFISQYFKSHRSLR
ncbi:ABC transporter permease subunit [Enterococcus sp. DIV0876]|uniref:ABC transporter permease subunit n=1 Tax=Enterococcus sp. DIV0876 TaxID=2774633 RepID=UPI003D301518